MKQLVLFLSILVGSTAIFAQNDHVKIISTKTNQVINGTTYKIYGDAARVEMKEQFKAVMESQDSSLIAIKRYEVSTIPGSDEYFCWYLCYTPTPEGTLPLWEAEDSLRLYMNDTVDNFSVYLRPNGTMGTACYRYVWQPESDPTDSAWVDICFEILTTGLEESNQLSNVSISPNPVSSVLNLQISEVNESGIMIFELRDIQGRVVFEERVVEGLNQLSISNGSIPKGLYLGSIRINDSRIWNERIVFE